MWPGFAFPLGSVGPWVLRLIKVARVSLHYCFGKLKFDQTALLHEVE